MTSAPETYLNVALSKAARQSSLSQWSKEEDASGAVNGKPLRDFAFHTDVEDRPWWELDLGHPYPLHRIVIHNRRHRDYQARGRTLRAEVSVDGKTWTTVHSGLCYFGATGSGEPLSIPLDGRVLGRYLRLSLDERNPLHLSQVEVFASRDVETLRLLFEKHGFDFPEVYRKVDPLDAITPYSIAARTEADLGGPLIGLSLVRFSRFGNNLNQMLNAISLAKHMGLKHLRTFDFESFSLKDRVTVEGLEFLPPDADLPGGGCFLSGPFFYATPFAAALGTTDLQERHRIAQDVLFPMMDFANCPRNINEGELAIHIRSGDLFSRKVPHPDYVQPPLAFYRRIIDKMLASGRIDRVCLVFEDRKNPCVNAVIAYLQSRSVPFRIQSGTLREDIEALLAAQHMVFGFGSFGQAICRLSKEVQSVHAYNDPGYVNLLNVREVTVVTDKAGQYIGKGQWKRDEAQLRMMVDYPEENLQFTVTR